MKTDPKVRCSLGSCQHVHLLSERIPHPAPTADEPKRAVLACPMCNARSFESMEEGHEH